VEFGPERNVQWKTAVPRGNSSPVIAGGRIFLTAHEGEKLFTIALDRGSGRILWRREAPRPRVEVIERDANGPASASPVTDGRNAFVFFADFGLLAYGPDGKLATDEMVDPRAKARFEEYLDLDDSGFLERRDWEQFRLRRAGESALRAYRLGRQGDLTESGFLWKNARSLPNVPSPLYYRGVLYTLKEGGIFTSYDIKTGEIVKQGRLQGALGTYFASPIAVDGRIYTMSEDGKAAVIEAGAQWEVLRVNDLKDGSKSTPAVADGRLYVRTYEWMYSFGMPNQARSAMMVDVGARPR